MIACDNIDVTFKIYSRKFRGISLECLRDNSIINHDVQNSRSKNKLYLYSASFESCVESNYSIEFSSQASKPRV